jgi:MoaA/NifB/PqqE/SkfB family radical SAM enzyme
MGGEPTLHPRILEIVGQAIRIGLRPTIITHGMHLANDNIANAYAKAGIHEFLVSVHGIGETAAVIHGHGSGNFDLQMKALDNLRLLGIPFRINITIIRDNLAQLEAITELVGSKGARVVNFITFNPYFEWLNNIDIDFQVRHSEAAPFLIKAIEKCTQMGIEANVRYLPLCQLPGYESHVYTGFQLPYDPHEWDFNSWYDFGRQGIQSSKWYLWASELQRKRHKYKRIDACSACAISAICDGFHLQYITRWGGNEVRPYSGTSVTDPCYFICKQEKVPRSFLNISTIDDVNYDHSIGLKPTQFCAAIKHRAGMRNEVNHDE